MTTDPSQHGSEAGSRRGESDRKLGPRPYDRLDETESVDPQARPASRLVNIKGYDIIRELHRGGQGVVYEAVQKSTKRKVAIKVLLEGQFASASARRRFEREVTLAAALKHPNIIAIFDSGEIEDGHRFCVMDYVRGTSIREHLRKNKLSLEETLELFCAVCEAVQFAHQKGVIHRDLKPPNILVDTDGAPKVLDFGLAKQLAGGTESLVSMTGQVVGTLPYMSPEQTRGNPDEIDARSDVYALGVILYELLTGQHPYPVKGEMYEVIKHITETEPTPPSKVWTPKSGVAQRKAGRRRAGQCPIDGELQTIAIKALAKERERRYQSAEALRKDIASYLAGEPVEAKRDSSLYVLRKLARRHRGQIAAIVVCVAVAAAALYVGLRAGSREVSAPIATGPITSLAVLPLENVSGDPDQEFFADGMTQELITALGRIKALDKIIAYMSVRDYKNTDKLPRQIARELKVHALVSGTVMPLGDRVRIAVNLIKGDTSEQVWGNSYDRELRDILAMQGDIARSIAREIKIAVTPAEESRLTSARQVDPESYKLYLKGQSHTSKLTSEGFKKGIECFEQAITLDPTYAPAWAGLAEVHLLQGLLGAELQEVYPRAMAAATKALKFDDTLGLAHATHGYVKFFVDWDWYGPEDDFQRALELNPGEAHVHYLYSVYLILTGRFDEGIAEIRTALGLDPFRHFYHQAMGWCYFHAGRYDESVTEYRRIIEKRPNEPWGYMFLALSYAAKGMYEEALAECEKIGGCHGDFAWVYAVAGKQEDALKEIDQLKTTEPVSSWAIATIYAGLGEENQALHWLQRAYEDHDPMMPWLAVSHKLDPLRDDPRFDDLLRRVGLEPTQAATFRSRRSPRGPKPPAPDVPDDRIMLAVLPFEDISPDPQDWFSDGMTGELIATLGKIKALGVISRTSAMSYKRSDKSLAQIARELNVSKLVEGSVLSVGGRFRITVDLIDATTDTHLWSDSYERDEADVITLQNEVARAIAREIRIVLTPAEESRLATARLVNPEAYKLFLKGQSHTNKWTPEGLKKAVEFFEQALALDPTYARAWAGLAEAYQLQHAYGAEPQQEVYPLARAAARKALELDDTLGLAHATLGFVKFFADWDWHGPEEDFRRGVEISPGEAHVHYLYSIYLMLIGRSNEGVAEIKRALELDPFQWSYNAHLGWCYFYARRYDESIAQYQTLLEKDPNDRMARFFIPVNYAAKGMYDEALAECAKMGGCHADLAWIYAVAGKREAALNEINRIETKKNGSSCIIAWIYAALGEKDQAFKYLEEAYAEKDMFVLWIKVAPELDALRDDPRFDDLLRRVGLEPTQAATFRSRGSPRGLKPAPPDVPAGRIMLAVLPFEDMSPDPQDWFSDGMTGELIATLGKIEALGVISRTSAMRYKNTGLSVPEIARELSVSKIVEGSVLRIGGRVRITVELIDAATDTHLWSNSYEHEERDVITLQNEVAEAIARQIEIAVTPAEKSRLTSARPVNPEAYRLYLQGQSYHYTWTEEGFKRAVESFEQAIALDPTCAPAWAGLAEVYLWQGLLGAERQKAYSQAMTAAGKALEFDDTLGLAHATLGYVNFFVDWDWYAPEEDFQRAVELSPGDPHVHLLYGGYLILTRRFDEGIAESKRAVELDPFQHYYHENMGWCYWMARRYNEAIAQYHKLIEKKPSERFYYSALADNYAANGMYDEALAECAKIGGCHEGTAWVYAVAGRRQRALEEIDSLKMQEPVNAWPIAVIYAGLGEKEQALQCLEKVYEDHSPMVIWFNISHKLDPLRDDPRFDDLLQRVGFEPQAIPLEQTP